MDTTLRFDDRVAIVTGAGRGLGRSYALLLGERGAKVVLNGRPGTIDSVAEVREEIRSKGGEAIVVAGLIGDDEVARTLVEKAVEHYGRIDIIVNNAGVLAQSSGRVEEMPDQSLEDYFNVHVRGSMQISRAAWPHMVKQHYGRILFTGSNQGTGWATGGDGYEMSYATVKAAMFGVTRQTAASGVEHNIKANLVMPSAYTSMIEKNYGGTDVGNWMKANLRPEQVAASIALLLHDDCPVTGEAISAGGGRVARVFFAATTGYFSSNLTPEDVRDNWAKVMGGISNDGVMRDVFEETCPREVRVWSELLNTHVMPDLSWIAKQPLFEF